MKNLFLTVALILAASSVKAETVTFDYTTSDPSEWESLEKDGSGYIANPLTCVETPVEIVLDGKFRRMVQQAFGGIECLLMYQNSTAGISVSEGYKITSVTFFSGNGKCGQLASVSDGTSLDAQVLTDVTYTHSSSGAELKQATRTATCGTPSQSVNFKVTAKGTQVITKIEVEYVKDNLTTYNFYNFTAFGSDALSDFPDIKVGTWWTTNPDDADSYAGGSEFRPLTISSGATTITFSYNGQGGHGNVRGTTTSKQNNLQLGGGSCFTITTDTEKYRLTKVEVQGNRKRTATGLSLVDQMTTNDDGTVSVDADTQILTWTPADNSNVACYLDANNGAYIESITAHYEGIGTGVADINVEHNSEAEYFTLSGIRCENPSAGIYIRRQGGKTEKIVIR